VEEDKKQQNMSFLPPSRAGPCSWMRTFVLPSLRPGTWNPFLDYRICMENALLALLGRKRKAYTSDTTETSMRWRKNPDP
jgi:hypothetical protein